MSSATSEGLQEPVAPRLARRLRQAVLDHAMAEHRRHFLPLVHVGWPGAAEATFPVRRDEPTDHALRADLVAALRQRAAELGPPGAPSTAPLVWLTRPGDLVMEDVDAAWLAAARQVYAEADDPLVLVVANRHGWWDPRSRLSRTWRRLRPRSGPFAR